MKIECDRPKSSAVCPSCDINDSFFDPLTVENTWAEKMDDDDETHVDEFLTNSRPFFECTTICHYCSLEIKFITAIIRVGTPCGNQVDGKVRI